MSKRTKFDSDKILFNQTKSITYGDITWARFQNKWWPATVVNSALYNVTLKTDFKTVQWFAEYSISEVKANHVIPFIENYKIVTNSHKCKDKSASWRTGVIAAIKEIYYDNHKISNTELLRLAENGFPNTPDRNNRTIDWLNKLVVLFTSDSEENPEPTRKNITTAEKELIKRSRELGVPLQICLSCYTNNTTEDHPLFMGRLCHSCLVKFRESYYAIGEDGIHYYCVICCLRGNLLVCEERSCGKTYCHTCIKYLTFPGTWDKILHLDEWHCFFCTAAENQQFTNLLTPRSDYSEKLRELYSDKFSLVPVPEETQRKRGIRVLSLFDGIGTGYFVLKTLNMEIEKYYASEIDSSCASVVTSNFGNLITNIGDARDITEESIKKISPIDLLIGGSPCNDLSLANPARKGLYDISGTGVLFFEYYRILNLAKKYNPDGFYWLFENVSSMNPEMKKCITRYLQCEPTLFDALHVSPQCRPRLFWGNCPTLNNALPIVQTNLQSYLQHGRTANVDRLRTVTTKRNSLIQTGNQPYPVSTSTGKSDVPSIVELEKIFGFPEHYTDSGTIALHKRMELLGKSWSVPVVLNILSFLKVRFAVMDNE